MIDVFVHHISYIKMTIFVQKYKHKTNTKHRNVKHI